jgi:hypothetical protein
MRPRIIHSTSRATSSFEFILAKSDARRAIRLAGTRVGVEFVPMQATIVLPPA